MADGESMLKHKEERGELGLLSSQDGQLEVEVITSGDQRSTGTVQSDARPADSKRGRLEYLDCFRGFIMLVMAWDHSRETVGNNELPKQKGFEFYLGPYVTYDGELALFLSRAVSHICAPGFFYTMGIGMALFTISRSKRGWSQWRIFKHFLVRGSVLVVMDRILCFAQSAADCAASEWLGSQCNLGVQMALSFFQVMTALGLSMTLSGALLALLIPYNARRLPHLGLDAVPAAFNLAGVLSVLLSAVLAWSSQVRLGEAWNTWNAAAQILMQPATLLDIANTVLFLPKRLNTQIASSMYVYPIFPWIGLTLFGIGAGLGFFSDSAASPGLVRRWLMLRSACCFAAFLAVRLGLLGPLGNLRGTPRGEGTDTLLDFLNVAKYPPSMAYLLITMSVNFALLSLFHDAGLIQGRMVKLLLWPFNIIGTTPLFFYMGHFAVLLLIRIGAAFTIHHLFPLEMLPLWWLVVAGTLLIGCWRYGLFKASTPPESLWRLL